MTDRLVSEVIRETRSVLFRRGWTQGSYDNTQGVCVAGACFIADASCGLYPRRIFAPIMAALDAADVPPIGWEPYITGWNDNPHRTFNDVIDMLDRAEKFALIAEEAAA